MNELARTLESIPVRDLLARADRSSAGDVRAVIAKDHRDLKDLAVLLSPPAEALLEEIAHASASLTARRFGRTILLYAPLYLSNECVNVCTYCGFRRDIEVRRTTLGAPEIEEDLLYLAGQGFRHILLVTGEHPKHVDLAYLEKSARLARSHMPSVSIEVEPLATEEYRRLIDAGIDGVTLYQETYDRDLYGVFHTHGPKRRYDWRLDAPSRAAEAGIRRLGLGALLGLGDWRCEALLLAAHAMWLLRRFWRTQVTISFPRIREAASHFAAPSPVGDRDLVRLVAALRLVLPDVGLVLSTREGASMRDGLARIGITQMSAGSRTEPGGYHRPDDAEKQFEVEDTRSPSEVAARLRELGLDPVWKDWEEALHG
ncbi:MAG: 2-iminoacetate synthase ThiH [Candidatus Latescibacterota bacterium]|nr:MAG: 2-iminoacetate synthase ThiH [Candidatus Latescibacterota bacterium]